MEELRRRLTDRGTETPDKINARLAIAEEEAKQQHIYDYVVVNDDLATAINDVRTIIKNNHN